MTEQNIFSLAYFDEEKSRGISQLKNVSTKCTKLIPIDGTAILHMGLYLSNLYHVVV